MSGAAQLVRTIAEQCWSDAAGVDRLATLVAPDYVHHLPDADWTFDQLRAGLAWVDEQLADRRYQVQHVLVDGDLAAAYVFWTAIRRSDGSPVHGSGAYHARVVDGRVAEDWDVFYPLS